MRRINPEPFTPRQILVLTSFAAVVFAAACGASTQQDTAAGAGASTASSGAGGQGSQSSSGEGGSSLSGFNPSTGSGMSGSGAGGACGGPSNNTCEANAECDDSDPSTTDSCVIINPQSEFPMGSCVHVPCEGQDCTSQPVDPTCSEEGNETVVYPPFVPIVPPGVPASCSNGFELTDAQGAPNYVIHTNVPSGSQGLTLDLDFATYTAPDGILITGIDGDCQPYVLFESCRLKTADKSWSAYGNGMERPDDIAIRQFDLKLLPGTTELTFDFSRVESPMYIRVLGLCDFDLPAVPGVKWSAPVP